MSKLTSELRLNNILQVETSVGITRYVKVVRIEANAVDTKSIGKGDEFFIKDGDHVTPVPITPDILKKCGFVEDVNRDLHLPINAALNTNLYHRVSTHQMLYMKSYYCPIMDFNCQSVHHLQNLYHLLTGAELKIKL